MKAIILAAGRGTRLRKYARAIPKGMLEFNGKPLIEYQVNTLRNAGVDDISIVTGYRGKKFTIKGVKFFYNPDYRSTNMLVSLFCAESELCDDVIVSYADIIYEERIPRGLKDQTGDVVVTIDKNWKSYWKARYGTVDCDLESLSLNKDGSIKELGNPETTISRIDGRYVGITKFSKRGAAILRRLYHLNKKLYWDKPWQVSGKPLKRAYMTDMLQEMIARGVRVSAYKTRNGWLEFDTNEDYERMSALLSQNKINALINLRSAPN